MKRLAVFFILLSAIMVAGCKLDKKKVATDQQITVTNLEEGFDLRSGFIYGDATGDEKIKRVDVKLDSGDFEEAEGTLSWKFQLPTDEDEIWVNNSEHTITIRTLNEIGYYSKEVSYTIRKRENRDFNGDGYVDFAVGAETSAVSGRTYIFHGDEEGIETKESTEANTSLTGEQGGSNFGKSIAIGDINNDGYADIAVGAPVYNTAAGRVYIFLGNETGVVSTNSISAATIITGQDSSAFGTSVAIGDHNGDGFPDLAVGAPNFNNNTGKVYIFEGSSSGIVTQSATSTKIFIKGMKEGETADPGNAFGSLVAFGNINGDGYEDLLITSPDYETDKGRLYIYYGSRAGITENNLAERLGADAVITGPSGSRLGISLALGYNYSREYQSIAIGTLDYKAGKGAVFLFHGSALGILDQDLSTITGRANEVFVGENAADQFGTGISFGDFDGDNYEDLAIGAPKYNELTGYRQGRAYLFKADGISGSKSVDLSNGENAYLTLKGEGGSYEFGSAVGFSDIDGDRIFELIVGAPNYNQDRGRSYIFYASPGGINPLLPSTNTITGIANSSVFGSVISQ